MSSPSCWDSIASALSPGGPSREAALREQLLAREEAAAMHRAAVQRLTDRADALQRRIEVVAREAEAARRAARSAEGRARRAEDQRRVAARTNEMHEEMLWALDKEMKRKDSQVTVLTAIVGTVKVSGEKKRISF
ncbi:hypothetical protein BRADI_2g07220v3 [Brachypodium distachyon]|uniref:Uncharacterized protein n=1 Tax=Brachypodium distachyon TaxID=15368 RepID=I1HDD1_BRADI|nr:hypothetical protein BRADI_2g07220v3 [Brachypodium distachyon]